ncbi:glycosyl hydrolases family 28-domain-containing protein [Jimgerdemannia flammicorona]|uniref:Glycosyl hydrolases family 28-domain-containing protein n=1 Tax=Jimgerdemannia flammicorona TaxID=994334 RepID=A0A433D0M9_9FUNG|nr:glycosyl hydrolases family 28-domain-containing protein [Jimgerdemannia flammicorona]
MSAPYYRTILDLHNLLAFRSGKFLIYFRITEGSIKAQIVDGVYVNNCTISNSDNGVRIKAYADATGGAANIHYTDITPSTIEYGITQRDYTNDGTTGVPGGAAPITNVYFNTVHGTIYVWWQKSLHSLRKLHQLRLPKYCHHRWIGGQLHVCFT